MNITCGECSKCGGRVTIPAAWYGINPPTPSCERCGATAKNPYGKVIETELPGVVDRLTKAMEREVSHATSA